MQPFYCFDNITKSVYVAIIFFIILDLFGYSHDHVFLKKKKCKKIRLEYPFLSLNLYIL